MLEKHKEIELFRPCSEDVARLSEKLGISRFLAGIMVARGLSDIDAAASFLSPSLHHLPDPFLLADMDKAVDRLLHAYSRQEKICVYGDYDMDGVAATAILVDFLRRCGFQADYFIPSRITDGYGLNLEAIEKIARQGKQVLLTVDCGISDYHETESAIAAGLEVIITDHHQMAEQLPPALAVINPHRPDCLYPDKNLAGVGVAFNLMMALRKKMRQAGLCRELNLLHYLDLVALGTVADVMPLVGVNRILTCFGLAEINKAHRPGLRALLGAARIPRGQPISARDLAFRLAPRVNAVGRIANAENAVELFLTRDQAVARQRADQLEEFNLERRRIEQLIQQEIDGQLAADEQLLKAPGLVLAAADWHPGVLGIVAARVAEKYQRPTLLLNLEGNVARGSGRSVPGVNLVSLLGGCRSLLTRFGGHEQAVGLTLDQDRLPELRSSLNRQLQTADSGPRLTSPCHRLDAILKGGDINLRLVDELKRLEPFGEGNPEPLFGLAGARSLKASISNGKGRRHARFVFAADHGQQLSGVAFDFNGERPENGCHFDLVFNLEENFWQGRREIRLRLVELLSA